MMSRESERILSEEFAKNLTMKSVSSDVAPHTVVSPFKDGPQVRSVIAKIVTTVKFFRLEAQSGEGEMK